MPLYALPPATSLVFVEGADAEDFLHRLSTVDVRALAIGEGRHGCLLQPSGKFIAQFTLWRHEPAAFAIEIENGRDDAHLKRFLDTLDRYTFSEKYTLTRVSGLQNLWWFETQFADPSASIAPGRTAVTEDGMRVYHRGDWPFGRPWLSIWARPEGITRLLADATEADRLSNADLERWRVESLGAAIDHEITEAVTPLDVGTRFAIADQKGCYPGQEVIEKVLAIGSPPKRLVAIEPGPFAEGDALADRASGRVVGSITTVAANGALALVAKTHATPGSELGLPNGATARVVRGAAE